jgi:hypothetical protein
VGESFGNNGVVSVVVPLGKAIEDQYSGAGTKATGSFVKLQRGKIN